MSPLRETILAQTGEFTTHDIVECGDWQMRYVSQTIWHLRQEGLVQKKPGTKAHSRACYLVLDAGRAALRAQRPDVPTEAARYDFDSLTSCMPEPASMGQEEDQDCHA